MCPAIEDFAAALSHCVSCTGEVRWLHPELPHLIRWDSTMGQDESPLQEVQDFLKEALAGPLLPMQQQQAISLHVFSPHYDVALAPESSERNPFAYLAVEAHYSNDRTQVWWQLTVTIIKHARLQTSQCLMSSVNGKAHYQTKNAAWPLWDINQITQQVLRELEANKKLVLSLSLTPSTLPQLVEHNPAIAFEVMKQLLRFSPPPPLHTPCTSQIKHLPFLVKLSLQHILVLSWFSPLTLVSFQLPQA